MGIVFMNTADLQTTSRWDLAEGIYSTVSTDYARTGTHSFRLGLGSNYQKAVTGRADYYVKYGLNIVDFAGGSSVTLAFREGTTSHVTIVFQSSAGTLKAYRGTNTGTLLGTSSTFTIQSGSWMCIECYVKVHDTEGIVTVKVNGVSVLALTDQDTQNAGTSVINNVRWSWVTGSVQTAYFIDDIVIRDDAWPGLGGVRVLVPNAAGSTANWTPSAGNAHDCVDELPPIFDDYVSTDASVAATLHLFNIGSLTVTPDVIAGVAVCALAKLSEAGSGDLRAKALAGATTANGTAIGLSTSELWADLYMAVNPADSEAWAEADIDGLQIGVETQ